MSDEDKTLLFFITITTFRLVVDFQALNRSCSSTFWYPPILFLTGSGFCNFVMRGSLIFSKRQVENYIWKNKICNSWWSCQELLSILLWKQRSCFCILAIKTFKKARDNQPPNHLLCTFKVNCSKFWPGPRTVQVLDHNFVLKRKDHNIPPSVIKFYYP